jgi:hypothetical protein
MCGTKQRTATEAPQVSKFQLQSGFGAALTMAAASASFFDRLDQLTLQGEIMRNSAIHYY